MDEKIKRELSNLIDERSQQAVDWFNGFLEGFLCDLDDHKYKIVIEHGIANRFSMMFIETLMRKLRKEYGEDTTIQTIEEFMVFLEEVKKFHSKKP